MTRTVTGPEIPEAEWKAKGQELFGPDMHTWKFVCPACGHVASVDLAKRRWPELEGKGWRPWSECIGRHTRRGGCDWAAYGLFCGPLKIKHADGKISFAFDFVGHPFSVHQKKGLDSPLREGALDEKRDESEEPSEG
jgi:hypothetical protein